MSITLFVAGTPAPQGSKRAFIKSRGVNRGRIGMAESSKGVAPWRRAVELEARNARNLTGHLPPTGPVSVSLEFVMPRPKSVRKPGCDVRPDVDKLVRSTLDALTGVLFADDSQVVRLSARKRYARPGGLERAGALIFVEEVEVSA